MQGEFHPAKSPGGLIAGWYRSQTIPPEYGEGQRRGLLQAWGGPHAITLRHTRSRFVPRGKWTPEL